MIGICSQHTYRHRLGIGSEVFQCLRRSLAGRHLIIEVTIDIVIFQLLVIRIGIRAVTASIDIAMDAGVNVHGITAIDLTLDIVSAIDIIDVTRINS